MIEKLQNIGMGRIFTDLFDSDSLRAKQKKRKQQGSMCPPRKSEIKCVTVQ